MGLQSSESDIQYLGQLAVFIDLGGQASVSVIKNLCTTEKFVMKDWEFGEWKVTYSTLRARIIYLK